MTIYDLVVVGGGPGGIMGAISAFINSHNNQKSLKIAIIEKNSFLGKKLLLTGGKRCNITNMKPVKELLLKTSNKTFLKHSFYSFPPEKLLEIFKSKGLDFKIEEDDKVYPKNGDSRSVLNILMEYLKEFNVDIFLNSPVENIKKEGDYFITSSLNNIFYSKNLLISTGGITYPTTGSTGDGYVFASNFSHTLSKIHQGLLSLTSNDNFIKSLSGISFKNITISFKHKSTKYFKKGDILFTHFGLSGPGILDLSNDILEAICLPNKSSDFLNDIFNNFYIKLDFLPQYNNEELKNIFKTEFNKNGKLKIKNYLKQFLPNRFIEDFLECIGVNSDKQLSNIKKDEVNSLVTNLKNFKVNINGFFNKEHGIITCGGVNSKEINPKTMESKIIKCLFFSGEVIDVYGSTGGYNLQIAFSTGYLAGLSLKLD
jgi:predicted Rossmann fold flavoprotein